MADESRVESRLDAVKLNADRLGWCLRDEMEAKLSSLPMVERNMLARVMNDIDEDQVRQLDSTSLDSAFSLRHISS